MRAASAMGKADRRRLGATRLAPIVGAWMLLASVLTVTAGAQDAAADPAAETDAAGPPATEPDALRVLTAFEDVLADVIARCEKSVVAIARVRPAGEDTPPRLDLFDPQHNSIPQENPTNPDFVPQEYGTGVVIGAEGLILTNYHVLGEGLQGYDFYVTTAERRPYRAKVIAADPRTDLAVLKIEATGLAPITFGDGSAVRKGQIVVTLGNPYAIARDGQASAGWGIISNVQRKSGLEAGEEVADRKPTLHHFGTLIQTDARLNLGTSGGPLLNLRGEMIGLITSLAAVAGYEQSAGYAIPVNDFFLRAVEELKHGREVEFGFLGVEPENPPAEQALAGMLGPRLVRIIPGTPAERAGLRPDDIVVNLDGQPIYDVDGLMLQVARKPVESNVRLTVRRNGGTRSIHVTLAKCPIRGKPVVTQPRPLWRGLRVDYATVLISPRVFDGGEVNLPALQAGCVAVVHVEPDSPAWDEGIRPRNVITHVGNVRVETPDEFYAAVANQEGAVTLHLGYDEFGENLGKERLASVPPEETAAEEGSGRGDAAATDEGA